MKNSIKSLLAVVILFFSFEIKAAPFDTGMITLTQPNDVTFTGRIWGDEFIYWAETMDGYRFVQSGDGWYYYATLNSQGEFSATTYKVGINTPPASSYQLERTQARLDEIQIQIEQFNTQVEINKQWYAQKQAEADAQGQPSVNLRIGIILIEYKDVKHYKTSAQGDRPNGYYKSDFENMMFSENYWIGSGTNSPHPEGEEIFGSFRDYWYQMSRGGLRIGGQVVNPDNNGDGVAEWLTANNNRSYYTDTYTGFTILGREAIQMAIDSGYISTTQGDPNHYDNYAIIYAQNPIVGISSTVGGYPNTNWYILGEQMGDGIFGEHKSFTHIGLNSHCFGVNIGFYDGPFSDLYTGITTSTLRFDLMNIGWMNGPNSKGECSATLNPYFRILKGWLEPTPITTDQNNFLVTYDYANPNIYKIDPPVGPPNMHYLFEVRKREGFDAYVPAPPETYQNQLGTLLIWQNDVEYIDYWWSGDVAIDRTRLKDADYILSESTQLNDFFPFQTNQCFNDTTLPAASIGDAHDEFFEYFIRPAHFALNNIQKLADGSTLIGEIKLNHPLLPDAIDIISQYSGNWQLVSLPVIPRVDSIRWIIPSASVVYKFMQSYQQVFTLENGPGYWTSFPTNGSGKVLFRGSQVEHLEIPVLAGWNLTGSISYNMLVERVCSEPAGIIKGIFRYDNGYMLMNPGDTLKSGSGYWTLVENAGKIILDKNGPPCNLEVKDLTNLDKFIITDAEGNKQTLYVSNVDIDTAIANIDLDLPPIFPEILLIRGLNMVS